MENLWIPWLIIAVLSAGLAAMTYVAHSLRLAAEDDAAEREILSAENHRLFFDNRELRQSLSSAREDLDTDVEMLIAPMNDLASRTQGVSWAGGRVTIKVTDDCAEYGRKLSTLLGYDDG